MLKDHEPCSHKGCLNHITHPCEGCGRISGIKKDLKNKTKGESITDLLKDRPFTIKIY